MQPDLQNNVDHIANTITNPDTMPYCPRCECVQDDGKVGDMCPDCGDIELGAISGYEYLADALDIEYIIAADRTTLLGARVLVAFGGPNIWINTRTNTVEGYWWMDSATASFTDNMGLQEALEEIFQC